MSRCIFDCYTKEGHFAIYNGLFFLVRCFSIIRARYLYGKQKRSHLNPTALSYCKSSVPERRYKENGRQQMAGSGGSLSFSPSTLIKLEAPCYVCRIRGAGKHPKSSCNWPSISVQSSQQIKPESQYVSLLLAEPCALALQFKIN